MSKPGYADQAFWFRLIFMLVFWVVMNIALTVFGALVLVVGVVRFLSKYELQTLTSWLKGVGAFLGQIFGFLSFATEEKPFPFQPWPQVKKNDEE